MRDLKIRITKDYLGISLLVLDFRHILRCIQTILMFLNITDEIEIKFSNDIDIERLNKEFLSVPGPTNVLSFPSDESGFLGSICISLETIEREATLYEQDLDEYFFRMLIHGILHLLGYEHSELMSDLTEKLLSHLKDNRCI